MNKAVNPRQLRGIVSVRAETMETDKTNVFNDINSAIEGINKAFEEFKAENNKRIDDLKQGKEDVVQNEKIDRINDQIGKIYSFIDELNAKKALANTPAGEKNNDTPEMTEFKANYDNWVRTGEGEGNIKAAYRSGGVMAAMSVGSDDDGGFIAPVEWDRTLTDKLKIVSPMRRYAYIQNIKTRGFKRVFNLHGTNSGWVGEIDARPETNTSKFSEYEYKFGEIYAEPAVTQSLLEDAEIDIAKFITEEVELEFSQQEGIAFLSGNGVKKPKGVLMYDKATEDALPDNEKHPLGPVLEVNSGSASAITADGLIDLTYDIPDERITENSAFYMNRKTHATIRKMKDGQGNYLWQPPFQEKQPALILGSAVHELAGMPDVGANTIPIIFGDMNRSYRIFDRTGVQVLRDPYTKKPYVFFYTRKRVGGGLWNPEFLRYHRVAV